MYDLILQLILMISFGIIVYLMAIAVPRIEDSSQDNGNGQNPNLPLAKVDAFLNRLKDKTLRRLKVFILKADNFISKQLNKKEEKL